MMIDSIIQIHHGDDDDDDDDDQCSVRLFNVQCSNRKTQNISLLWKLIKPLSRECESAGQSVTVRAHQSVRQPASQSVSQSG